MEKWKIIVNKAEYQKNLHEKYMEDFNYKCNYDEIKKQVGYVKVKIQTEKICIKDPTQAHTIAVRLNRIKQYKKELIIAKAAFDNIEPFVSKIPTCEPIYKTKLVDTAALRKAAKNEKRKAGYWYS